MKPMQKINREKQKKMAKGCCKKFLPTQSNSNQKKKLSPFSASNEKKKEKEKEKKRKRKRKKFNNFGNLFGFFFILKFCITNKILRI